MKVTRNLFEGLLRIRTSTSEVRLWVDAVCSNQSDTQEKTEQVARMGDIFAYARGIVAWFGDDDDDQAFRVLECSGTFKEANLEHTSEHIYEFRGSGHIRLCSGKWVDLDGTEWNPFTDYDMPQDMRGDYHSAMTALEQTVRRLLERRFFTRRWIIQELCLAKDGQFFCGPRRIGMEMLLGALWNLLHLSRLLSDPTIRRSAENVLEVLKCAVV